MLLNKEIQRRTISFLIMLSVLLSVLTFVPADAAGANEASKYINYEINNSLPEDWEAKPADDYASVEITDYKDEKSILISADTSALSSKTTSKAELFGELFNLNGKQVFSFRMAINSDEKGAYKRVYLNDGENKEALLVIKEGLLTVGDGKAALPIGEFFDLIIAVDTTTQNANVYLNNESVISTTVEFEDYVGKAVQLHFSNLFSSKIMSSLWYISKCERIENAEYSYNTYPENDAQIANALNLESIKISYNTAIILPENLTVTLEECDVGETIYTPLETEVTPELNCLYIKSVNGFSQPKKYRLTIPQIDDVFGYEGESIELNFLTAPEGYESPECVIEVEKDEYFVGETVRINADVKEGSEALTKAELYVNSILKETYTDSFNFKFTPDEGENSVYVKLYDASGGTVESNIITIIAKQNEAPTVNFSVSDGQSLEPGSKIKVSANDTDGEIVKITLRVDGKKAFETTENSFEWTVSEKIPLGVHTLEAYAVDNYGKTATTKINITVAKFTSKTKVQANYSNFTDNFTTGTKSVGSITLCTNSSATSERYIKSDTVEGYENCIVVGSKAYTGGTNKAWIGIQTFSDSNGPESIATFETNIFVSSELIYAGFGLKSSSEGCTLIAFDRGTIKYYNGSEAKTLALQTKKWYEIKAEMDLRTGKYTMILNGDVIADNYTLNKSLGSLSAIRLEVGNYSEGEAFIATNKFNIYDKTEFLSVTEAAFKKEGTDVLGEGADTVILTLKDKVDTASTKINEVKFFAEDKELKLNDFSVNENKMILNLKNILEAGYSYKVRIGYTFDSKEYISEYSFETPLENNEGIEDGSFVVKDSEIKFTANVKSNTEKTARVIIAKFENNILTEIKSCDVDLTGNSDNYIESSAVYYDDSENVTYKIYIWSSWADRTAIGNKIFEFSNCMTDL